MKRFIFKIFVFFCIIAAIDCGVSSSGNFFKSHAKGGSTKEFYDLVLRDNHDVLVLGSSRAHHHYDTQLLSDSLNLSVYNAGYDGNGVILAYGILEMVLNRSKPLLIIYDVEPFFDIEEYELDNNRKRYIRRLKPYYKEHGVENVIKDVSKEEWYKSHSGMIRYNTDIIRMIIDNLIIRNTSLLGYSPLSGKMTKVNNLNNKEITHTIQYDYTKLKYVEKLIDLAQAHRVSIVLVASPKFDKYPGTILNPIRDICVKKEVPFWDYYADEYFLTHPEWFKEPMHLNRTGAQEFSNLILRRIKPLLYTN